MKCFSIVMHPRMGALGFFSILLPAIVFAGVRITLSSNETAHTFKTPIDALSVRLDNNQPVSVRAKIGETWTAWQHFTVENEQDPTLRESNLVLFPASVSEIQIDGKIADADMHPIRVSHALPSYQIASTTMTMTPHILTRADWGADTSFLYTKPSASSSSNGTTSNSQDETSAPLQQTSQRIADCQQAQQNYPQEFKTVNHQTKDSAGNTYRWAHDYSPSVKLIVVHHTAIDNTGDNRPGIEKVRALYQYHANSRGWGDIGYHYVIDSDGQIYEGKSGGPYVVGGHAYCNNVGTIGIAMLGNFDDEDPTQAQVHSLQWLVSDLGTMYDIDLTKNTTEHGKTLPPVVGHRDLLSTDCPGYYLYGALAQVRQNVIASNLLADVTFPAPINNMVASTKPFVDQSQNRRQQRVASLPPSVRKPLIQTGVTPMGSTDLSGRPSDSVLFTIRYIAGDSTEKARSAVADIASSDPSLTLWEELNGSFVTVRDQLLLPDTLPAHGSVQIRLKAELPFNAGTSTLTIGQTQFTVTAAGRRQLGARGKEVIPESVVRASLTQSLRNNRRPVSVRRAMSTSSESPSQGDPTTTTGSASSSDSTSPTIRVLITSENRIVTLSLEDYMMGIGEEPDTEPYEKQRAFAIAARTYAAYYLSPDHRKFPGQDYDATDDPATFQKYSGPTYTQNNPNWVKAVQSTAGMVLTKNGQLIKPPYFSSDDGRTRSPSEANWGNFPFSEIFTSKPDPWCKGLPLNGHGVGMSGCGAKEQALSGKTAEEILLYYYPTTVLQALSQL